MSIDEKLGANKFLVDEGNPHILVDKSSTDLEEKRRLVKICPAGLYKLDEEGVLSFDYIGCLECGACRVLCADTLIQQWKYPCGEMGVEYRKG